MRISDWSSDVCSSDLTCPGSRRRGTRRTANRNSRPAPEMAAARMDYEPAGELKIGQVGIANLRVRTLDVAQLAAEMRERVARAPKLFARAADRKSVV